MSIQVIGNDVDNIIDIGCGTDSVVYTGSGNNVVLLKGVQPPIPPHPEDDPTIRYSQRWFSRRIVGGSGHNTLILNGHNEDGCDSANFVLFDDDDNRRVRSFLTNDTRVGYDTRNIEGSILLRNVQTIQANFLISNQTGVLHAGNLEHGRVFILNGYANHPMKFRGTHGDDTIYVKSFGSNNDVIDGGTGKNVVSLEQYDGDTDIGVDLDRHTSLSSEAGSGSIYKMITGGECKIKGATIVRGSHGTKEIKGHLNKDNVLSANGGSCTIEGRGGTNTLGSERGNHTLRGGTGADTYIIHGPIIEQIMTVTVRRETTAGYKASSVNGTWAGGVLCIDLVPDISTSTERIVTGSVAVVNQDRQTLTMRGSVSITPDRRYIQYSPRNDFQHLRVESSETVRIKFSTDRSTATIEERSYGNRIELKSIPHDGFKVQVATSSLWNVTGLEFITLPGDGTNQDQVILTDTVWGANMESGMRNLGNLCLDFARRFIEIKFVDKTIRGKDVYECVWNELKDLVSENNAFDNISKASDLEPPITLQKGTNILYANVKGTTYTSGGVDDVIDASAFESSDSSSTTEIVTGGGTDTVVVSAVNADKVKVRFHRESESVQSGSKTLIIKHQDESIIRARMLKDGNQVNISEPANLTKTNVQQVIFYNSSTSRDFLTFDVANTFPDVIVLQDTNTNKKTLVPNPKYFIVQKSKTQPGDGFSQPRILFEVGEAADLQVTAHYENEEIDNLSMTVGFAANSLKVLLGDLELQTSWNYRRVTEKSDIASVVVQKLSGGVKGQDGTSKAGDNLYSFIVDKFNTTGGVSYSGVPPDAVYICNSDITISRDAGKDIVVIEPQVRRARVEFGSSERKTYLILRGRSSAEEFSQFNKFISLKVDGVYHTICRLDPLPDRIIFVHNDGEMEFVDNAADYFTKRESNHYQQQRWFATREGVPYIDARDVTSSKFGIMFKMKRYDYTWYRLSSVYLMEFVNFGDFYEAEFERPVVVERYQPSDELTELANTKAALLVREFAGGVLAEDKVITGAYVTHSISSNIISESQQPSSLATESDAKAALLEALKDEDNIPTFKSYLEAVQKGFQAGKVSL